MKKERPESSKPKPAKKEFDPRKDKILDIATDDDILMDSLKNFKPPADNFMDKSASTFLEKKKEDETVIAGVKMKNMVDNYDTDFDEIRQLEA